MKSVKMKHLLFVCMGLLLALSYAGCSNSGSEERTENLPTSVDSTENVLAPEESAVNMLVYSGNSGCKTYLASVATENTRGETSMHKEVIQYECTSDGYLLINHINSLFSCDAQITTTAYVGKDVITIKEYAPPTTDCICVYDVDMKIGPLKNQDYTVVLDKGYPNTFSFTLSFPSSEGEVEVNWEQ
jgi:hypothetical protein